MKLVSLILFCLVSPSYSQPRDSVVTRLIQYVVKRVRENDPYPRMPDYIPPVVDDLRTDEHGNCLSDQIPCWDGTNASRNAELDCEFNQCPPRKYCHNDVKKCPDGSYMIRNPWRDCFFHACPEVADCTPDKYRCWDGSYVSRNPRDECHFLPCPPMKYCQPDEKICQDGSRVYRNKYKECIFDDCPPEIFLSEDSDSLANQIEE